MKSSRIAVAGCRRETVAAPDDLYPDRDAPYLRTALRSLGVSSTLVSWDDASMAWEQFSAVVISSTWDSVDRPSEYVAWARQVSQVTNLVNDVATVEWNLDKTHQRDLQAAGVPTIPTDWIAPGDPWTPPNRTEFVVKPTISAGQLASGDDLLPCYRTCRHQTPFS